MAQVGCLVLASGLHRRFGSPKLMQKLVDGRTLISHTLTQIKTSGMDIALIHRSDDLELLHAVAAYDVITIENPEADAGIGASIARGVRATEYWDGWLICLADMPLIAADTYRRLGLALQDAPIVIPTSNGIEGNPRGFQRVFLPDLLSLSGDNGAKELIARHRDQVCAVDVQDPGVLLDVDQPQDLLRINRVLSGSG